MHNSPFQRIVALVDMDCFYCQVEARLNPSLKGKPVAVVQYNQWKGGGIIAVNYEARDRGVCRSMRGEEAKKKCPDIVLVSVPTIRGKADLSNYRDAGDEVAKVFSEFSDCVQRASIDEAYLDVTKAVEEYIQTKKCIVPDDLPNTFVVGHCDLKSKNEGERAQGLETWLKLVECDKNLDNRNYRLAIGGIIVEKMRLQIFEKTGFRCSAGIAHNKILAKLSAGLHKPNKQTILPHDGVPELYETLPIYKVRNLGGKLGKQVSQKLSITYMSELYKFNLQELQQKFDEKTSSWLYNIARGIDSDPVTSRLVPESIGCCKNFSGLNKLVKKADVQHWVKELATEVSERLLKDLEANKRRAKLLTVSFYQETPMTRCVALNSYDVNKIVNDAMELLNKFNSSPSESDLWKPPIKCLGLSASKFTEELTSIEKFLKTRLRSEIAEKKQSSDDFPSTKAETGISKVAEKPSTSKSKSFFLDFINQKKSSPSESSSAVETKSETNKGNEANGEIETEKAGKAIETKEATKGNEANGEIETDKAGKAIETKEAIKGNEKNEAEEANETEFISLTELIPDLREAEEAVIEILPEPLKRKFQERLNFSCETTGNGIVSDAVNDPEVNSTSGFEKCNECGRKIRIDIFLEHLDYHVALKLDSEINRKINGAVGGSAGNKSDNESGIKRSNRTEIQGKRKKGGGTEMNSKKMRSITSFFAVGPK